MTIQTGEDDRILWVLALGSEARAVLQHVTCLEALTTSACGGCAMLH